MSKTNPYAAKSEGLPERIEAADSADTASDAEVSGVSGTAEVEVVETEATPEVPKGSVNEVLEWVGDDKDRARAALEAEGEDGRKTLVKALEDIVEND